MRKRIVIVNGLLVFFSIFVLFICSMLLIKSNNEDSSNKQIQDYSLLVEKYFNGSNIDETITYFKNINDLRVTVFDSNLNFITDSKVDNDDGDNRPELSDLGTIYTRYSSNLNSDMMYLAVEDDGYILRVSIEVNQVTAFINLYIQIGIISISLILLCSVCASLILLKNTMKPINNVVFKLQELCDDYITEFDEEELYKQITSIQCKIQDKIDDLEKEKLKVEGIIEASIEGIIVIDYLENILLINEKALNIFSLNKSVVNSNYTCLLKSSELTKQIKKSLSNKENSNFIIHVENYVYNVDVINLSKNNIEGIMITLSDITIEFNLAKVKKDFFQNASHELKSPLTTILGYQQLIKTGIYTTKEDILDGVDSTIKEANKMKNLILDMLVLSQLESEYQEEVTEVNLKLVILEILDSFKLKINEKNINILLNVEDSIHKINIKHASQLLKNLIENGIKYNKENGSLTITLNQKEFSVLDNGIGIDSKNTERIFERFFRVSSNNKIKGNGLGLAIVKHICNIYNYEITVDSVLTEYTNITIKL